MVNKVTSGAERVVIRQVSQMLSSNKKRHPPFTDPTQVIGCLYDELHDLIHAKAAVEHELIQIAAIAIRAVIDLKNREISTHGV